MGQGIAWSRPWREHVMIDWEYLEDPFSDSRLEAFDDVKYDIKACLPSTYSKFILEFNRDMLLVAKNKQFEVGVADDGHYVHILFQCDQYYPLAMANLHRVSKAFFDRLGKIYRLRVATSAWTSGPRRSV